jgi:ribosome-binding protein aMBF1 (putative translation factor)
MGFKKIKAKTFDDLHKQGIEKFGDDYIAAIEEINYKKSLAQTLKEARENQGLTQYELAKLLNRKPQKISEYERSIRIPSVINLINIAKVLHCTLIIDPEDKETPIKITPSESPNN